MHWISIFYYDTYCEMQGDKDRELRSLCYYKKTYSFHKGYFTLHIAWMCHTNGFFWLCFPSVPGISPSSIFPSYHVQRSDVYTKVLSSIDLTEHIAPSLTPLVALLLWLLFLVNLILHSYWYLRQINYSYTECAEDALPSAIASHCLADKRNVSSLARPLTFQGISRLACIVLPMYHRSGMHYSSPCWIISYTT